MLIILKVNIQNLYLFGSEAYFSLCKKRWKKKGQKEEKVCKKKLERLTA